MEPSLLIVDDEAEITDLYAMWLADDYDVHVAHDADSALDEIAEREFDAVMLDHRLSDGSGDDVLLSLRSRGYDGPIALVTAVPPDFDILEMGFDDYVEKPVGRDALVDTVADLVETASYDELHRRLTARKVSRNVLRVEKTRATLDESDEFARLQREIERLEAELEARADAVRTATLDRRPAND